MSMCIMVRSRIGTSFNKWEHMFVYGILNDAPVFAFRQSNKRWNLKIDLNRSTNNTSLTKRSNSLTIGCPLCYYA